MWKIAKTLLIVCDKITLFEEGFCESQRNLLSMLDFGSENNIYCTF